MTDAASTDYDVAIVGAGPVGSLCALAHAQQGNRVVLLGGNPKAATRLAGEWLHPPAVDMLASVGIRFDDPTIGSVGNGFVVYPEDGSAAITLPYPQGRFGHTYEHAKLVEKLHEAIQGDETIEFYPNSVVRSISEQRLSGVTKGAEFTLHANRIVGADGRVSVVRNALDLSTHRVICSRMVGVLLQDVELPQEDFGHVVLAAPGPILIFPLGSHRARVIADVPQIHASSKNLQHLMLDSYSPALPVALRETFDSEVRAGNFQIATNDLRPRVNYGTSQHTLIGDAAGHYHPLTAVGMTLGFGDAIALAKSQKFSKFATTRLRNIRSGELLAMGLYEVFADDRADATALRNAVYARWRASSKLREKTMKFLACDDTSIWRFARTFFTLAWRSAVRLVLDSCCGLVGQGASLVIRSLAGRIRSTIAGYRKLRRTKDTNATAIADAWRRLATGLVMATQEERRVNVNKPAEVREPVDASQTLENATRQLLAAQREDGAWEGEMVWCPMLTAQYVLLHHILSRPISPARQKLLLKQFEQTQLPDGTWGLHAHSHPYLFVTTLVYVTSRLLGVNADDPMLSRAKTFVQNEGITTIPSWGKFWLALMNLYDWRGLNAVLPELWLLPTKLPFHPSNWYCHTRLIYMAMASIYATRFQTPLTETIAELRTELYPNGYDQTKFSKTRNSLRTEDLFAPPGFWLRCCYRLTRGYELMHSKVLRKRALSALLDHIRWELNSSTHTSISPVSGSLNILSLWLNDKQDLDLQQAFDKLEDWIWEDEGKGTRITGARSATWDTGFALQALAQTNLSGKQTDALERGSQFLASQQIRESSDGYLEAFRSDPKGGWCFAGVWHGWPVSDCTAEALLGLLETDVGGITDESCKEAVQFILRSQNRDGGFGSYEAQRSRFDLEWLNPAEMFGESMTEHSFVECTGSCMAALIAAKHHFPSVCDEKVDRALLDAEAWLRKTQLSDGSWRGVWGVQFIYGTWFGIRGLMAAGVNRRDPALRAACRWLCERQNADGGWGEDHRGCIPGEFIAREDSQVVQTAWALTALLEAQDSDWQAISRGAKFLQEAQNEDGSWPEQDMVGVFFRTALLDYRLYRYYFPIHALGLYEKRRIASMTASPSSTANGADQD